MGRLAVCVEVITCWLATWTTMGFLAGCLLRTGVVLVTKLPLLPESSIVKGGEGPSVEFKLQTSLSIKLLLWVPGVPLTQVLSCGGVDALSVLRVLGRGRRLDFKLLRPPMRLPMEASGLWPSLGAGHRMPGCLQMPWEWQ
jgi:hypothetical protein